MLESLVEWLRAPENRFLREALSVWVVRVLSSRMPGIRLPQVADLKELKTMLADRVEEWTRRWREEALQQGLEQGLERGLQQGLERLRGILLRDLESRFGELSGTARAKVAAIDSIEQTAELIARAATAPSLGALGLE